jgi:hypothetical protein
MFAYRSGTDLADVRVVLCIDILPVVYPMVGP